MFYKVHSKTYRKFVMRENLFKIKGKKKKVTFVARATTANIGIAYIPAVAVALVAAICKIVICAAAVAAEAGVGGHVCLGVGTSLLIGHIPQQDCIVRCDADLVPQGTCVVYPAFLAPSPDKAELKPIKVKEKTDGAAPGVVAVLHGHRLRDLAAGAGG